MRKSSYAVKSTHHRQKYRRVDQKFGQPRQSGHITFDGPQTFNSNAKSARFDYSSRPNGNYNNQQDGGFNNNRNQGDNYKKRDQKYDNKQNSKFSQQDMRNELFGSKY